MRGQRFHAEGFGRVMATEQKIDFKLFGRDRGPVRRFASNESVDLPAVAGSAKAGLRFCDAVNFSAGSAGDNSNVPGILWTEVERFQWPAKHLSEFPNQIVLRDRNSRSNSNQLSLLFEKRFRRFES